MDQEEDLVADAVGGDAVEDEVVEDPPRRRSPSGPSRVPKPSPTSLTRKKKPSMLNVLGPAPGETMYSLGDAAELGGNETRLGDGRKHRKAIVCTGNSYARYAALGLVDRSKRRLDKAVQMAAASRGFQRRARADFPQTVPGPVGAGILPNDTPIYLKFAWEDVSPGMDPERFVPKDPKLESLNNLKTAFQPEAVRTLGRNPPVVKTQQARNATATQPLQIAVERVNVPDNHLDGVVAMLRGVPFGETREEAQRQAHLLSQSLSNAKRMWSLQSQCQLIDYGNEVQYLTPKLQARSAPWELFEGYRLLRVAEMFPEPPLALCVRRITNEDDRTFLDFYERVDQTLEESPEDSRADPEVLETIHRGEFVPVNDLRVVPQVALDDDGNDLFDADGNPVYTGKYDLEFEFEGKRRSTADPFMEGGEDYDVDVVIFGKTKKVRRRRFPEEGSQPKRLRLYIRPNPKRVSDEVVYATVAGTTRRTPNRLSISHFAMHFWNKCGTFNPEGVLLEREIVVPSGSTSPVNFPPALAGTLAAAKRAFSDRSYGEVTEAVAIQAYERARNMAHNKDGQAVAQPGGYATTCSRALDALHQLLGSQALKPRDAPARDGEEVGQKLKALAGELKKVVVDPDHDCAPGIDEELSDDRVTRRFSGEANGLDLNGNALRWSQLTEDAKLALKINRWADEWFGEQVRWIERRAGNGSKQTGQWLYWENVRTDKDTGFPAPILTLDGQNDYDVSFADFFPPPALVADEARSDPEIKNGDGSFVNNPFFADPTFSIPVGLQSRPAQFTVQVGNRRAYPYLPYRMPVYRFDRPVNWAQIFGPNPPNPPPIRFKSYWPSPKEPTLEGVYLERPPYAELLPYLDDALPLLNFLKTSNEQKDIMSYAHLLRILPEKKPNVGICATKIESQLDKSEFVAKVLKEGERDALILAEVPVVNPTRGPDPEARAFDLASLSCRPQIVVPVGTPASAYWEAFRSVASKAFIRASGKHLAKGPGVRELVSRQFRYGIYNRVLQHWLYRHGFVTEWLGQKIAVPLLGDNKAFDHEYDFDRLKDLDVRLTQAAAELEATLPVPGPLATNEALINYVQAVEKRLDAHGRLLDEQVAFRGRQSVREALAHHQREKLFAEWGFDDMDNDNLWFVRSQGDRGGFVSTETPAKSSRAMYPLRLSKGLSHDKDRDVLWLPDSKGGYADVIVDRRSDERERTYKTAPIDPSTFPRVKLDGLFGLKRTVRVRNDLGVESTKIVNCLPSDPDWLRWLETATPQDLVFDSYNLVWSNYQKPYGWDTLGLDFASPGVQFLETRDRGKVVDVSPRPRTENQPADELTSFSWKVPVVREKPKELVDADAQDFAYGDYKVDYANALDALQAFDATREYYIRKLGRARPGVGGAVRIPAVEEQIVEEEAEQPAVETDQQEPIAMEDLMPVFETETETEMEQPAPEEQNGIFGLGSPTNVEDVENPYIPDLNADLGSFLNSPTEQPTQENNDTKYAALFEESNALENAPKNVEDFEEWFSNI